MVKIQDGSIVPASELLGGAAQDDEVGEAGSKLKFEQVKDAAYPTWKAEGQLNDGSNRKRTYQFSLADTNVTVHVTQTTEQEEAEAEQPKPAPAPAAAKTEKVVKEVDTKKNTTATSASSSSSGSLKK